MRPNQHDIHNGVNSKYEFGLNLFKSDEEVRNMKLFIALRLTAQSPLQIQNLPQRLPISPQWLLSLGTQLHFPKNGRITRGKTADYSR